MAFAIDHNNLTQLGGDLGFTKLLPIWDEPGLKAVLTEAPDASELLVSLDSEDVDALLSALVNLEPWLEGSKAEEGMNLQYRKTTLGKTPGLAAQEFWFVGLS